MMMLAIQIGLVFAVGWLAGAGLFAAPTDRDQRLGAGLLRWVLSLILGWVLYAWVALILGTLGVWRGGAVMGLPGLAALGIWWMAGRPAISVGRPGIGALAAVLLAGGLVALLPTRSEWMVGGWDPGIYTDEALSLVRRGTLKPEPHAFYQALGGEVGGLFTRSMGTHVELFPGVPIDPDSGKVSPSFPRLTPAFMAVWGWGGGMRGVFQSPLIMALAAMALGGILAARYWGIAGAGWAFVILMAGQPIWVHYAGTPTSEMTELLLLVALLAVLSLGQSSGRAGWIWEGLLIFSLSANRLSFLLFGAMGLCGWALWEGWRGPRRRAWLRLAVWAVALWGGHAIFDLLTPMATAKLAHILPRIRGVSLLATAAALLLVGGLFRPGGSHPLRTILTRWAGAMATALGLLVVLGLGWGGFRDWELTDNACAWLGYSGWVLPIIVWGGVVFFLARGDPAIGVLIGFLGASLLIVFWQKHAADLYPWAAKRYLTWGVPLLAVGGTWVAVEVSRRLKGVGVWVCALILTLPAGKGVAAAWRAVEFPGISVELDRVAAELGPTAGVIADHFRWATPLALAYGLPVLDGGRLLRDGTATEWQLLEDRLREMERQGWPIYLLDTGGTGEGWARLSGRRKRVWASEVFPVIDLHHHASNRDFPMRTNSAQMVLYEWHP